MGSLNDHSIASYEALVTHKLREHPRNRDLALAQCIGALTLDIFESQGKGQVEVLQYHGLKDGMSIYDLGCGCGRTAQALYKSGWKGRYKGADIIQRLVDEIRRKCPGYEAIVHRKLTVAAPDNSLDILYHWSVFTHLFVEECFLYMQDIFRALRPGGKMIFSFLELDEPAHHDVFHNRMIAFRDGAPVPHLDTFLHRNWIRNWADQIGFTKLAFTDGNDYSQHPAFWQTLVSMEKPM